MEDKNRKPLAPSVKKKELKRGTNEKQKWRIKRIIHREITRGKN